MTIHTGKPENWHVGVPISLGLEAGEEVIFWSSRRGCHTCGGEHEVTHERWSAHMRQELIVGDGYVTGRLVCPNAQNNTPHLRPGWRRALS